MDNKVCEAYIRILRAELIRAEGCTEPIAICLASARMKKELGEMPERITVWCSGNIIKNAKSVVVPGTEGMKGIPAAAVFGAVCGDPAKELEVIAGAGAEDVARTKEILDKDICRVCLLEGNDKLHIIVRGELGEHFSEVELKGTHNGIVRVETDRGIVQSGKNRQEDDAMEQDYALLNAGDIIDFAETADVERVKDLLLQQAECNGAIAEEGLRSPWGAEVGRTILSCFGNTTETLAQAYAAAGSDARMNGCELPVVINSGSGNQGMTASLPVVVYARALGADQEHLIRALCLSNLMAIYEKSHVGRLSAFCGTVSAGAGAGAGIAYLCGADHRQICDTVINTLGSMTGLVCDGAKASCAAKIAASVNAAIVGFRMAMAGIRYQPGDGVVKKDLDSTVETVSRIAKEGMEYTDQMILQTMLEE